jgi:PAS domain-containing protein
MPSFSNVIALALPPQLITVLSPGGDILYVNEQVVEFTGLPREGIFSGDLPAGPCIRKTGFDSALRFSTLLSEE